MILSRKRDKTLTKEGLAMTQSISKLIEMAKKAKVTPEQQEEQRRSFAFGNTAIENSQITREMIDKAATAS